MSVTCMMRDRGVPISHC